MGRNEVISAPPQRDGGFLVVPTAPGLGVDIVEDVIARYPSQRNVSISAGGYEPGTEKEFLYQQVRLRRAASFRPRKRK